MDEHDYWQDEINQLELDEMLKHCPGCIYWDDYYLCMQGGIMNCIYTNGG